MKRAVSGTTPAAAYSPGMVAEGRFVYVSGQGPLRNGEVVEGGISEQTEVVLENVGKVLAETGASLADVVRCGVFLTDLDDFAAMNEAYERAFGAPLPARTTVGVAALPGGIKVEIDAVAVLADREEGG
jgi:2-iminobutanoate/2-iminopropanoate deaminase